MRVIGAKGEQIGILPTREALDRAREQNLDLVEVAPLSKPPVCRIMDFGKYKYELAKRDKQAKKKQHSFQLKEMRFRPKIDEHDYQFKTRHVREFLESGSKVKVLLLFRGREMAHQEFGAKIMERVKQDLTDVAVVDTPPKMEGNSMNMVLSPKPEVMRKLASGKPGTKAAKPKATEPAKVEAETEEQ